MCSIYDMDICEDCWQLAEELVPADGVFEVGGSKRQLCNACLVEWQEVERQEKQ
jgi:hypothetical protein